MANDTNVVYGPGGFDTTKPNNNAVSSVTVAADPILTNKITITQRAQTALTNNQNYLAIVSPTQAQAVAQVGALTRQVDGLIRFLLSQFDTITDS
jgi:hypothetical protein